jgi:hypothetical protein
LIGIGRSPTGGGAYPIRAGPDSIQFVFRHVCTPEAMRTWRKFRPFCLFRFLFYNSSQRRGEWSRRRL